MSQYGHLKKDSIVTDVGCNLGNMNEGGYCEWVVCQFSCLILSKFSSTLRGSTTHFCDPYMHVFEIPYDILFIEKIKNFTSFLIYKLLALCSCFFPIVFEDF